jgi:hypothetical protein
MDKVLAAAMLATALRCHPAVLVYPGWQVKHGSAAYLFPAPDNVLAGGHHARHFAAIQGVESL